MAEAIRLRMNDSSCSANYSISADFTIVVWQKEVVRTNTAQLAVLACGSHCHRPKTSLCLCRNVVKLSHYSGLCAHRQRQQMLGRRKLSIMQASTCEQHPRVHGSGAEAAAKPRLT